MHIPTFNFIMATQVLEELAVASHAVERLNQLKATGMVRKARRGCRDGATVQGNPNIPSDIRSCSRLGLTDSRVQSSNSFQPTFFFGGKGCGIIKPRSSCGPSLAPSCDTVRSLPPDGGLRVPLAFDQPLDLRPQRLQVLLWRRTDAVRTPPNS